MNIDSRGNLYAIDLLKDCDFSIKRIFLISNVPVNSVRGKHAHYKTEQLLICISGKVCIKSDQGNGTKITFLSAGQKFRHIPLEWAEITFLEENTILMSLCNTEFDPLDYIKDYNTFCQLKAKQILPLIKCNMLELKNTHTIIKKNIDNAINNVLNTAKYIGGEEINMFEEEFSKYLNSKYCVTCANGTDAIIMALRALNITQGDDVILQGNAFIADAMAIESVNANIIYIDQNDEYQLNIKLLNDVLTKKTKAILLVHMYGMSSCDIQELSNFCIEKNIYLIEDCSHVHGAKFKHQFLGTFGNIGCFSFYPSKNLGAIGDAGCCVTNDESLKNKLCKLKNYGASLHDKTISTDFGLNSRMDTIQAAVLRVKLKYLDSMNICRVKNANYYLEKLKNIDDLYLVQPNRDFSPVYHQFVIATKYREKLKIYLKNNNIETMIHYPTPPYLQPFFKKNQTHNLMLSNEMSQKILSIPIHPDLSFKEIEWISLKISDFFKYNDCNDDFV